MLQTGNLIHKSSFLRSSRYGSWNGNELARVSCVPYIFVGIHLSIKQKRFADIIRSGF